MNKVKVWSKIPELTLFFWVTKICATTLGETAGDLLSMTLKIGYATSSIILISLFIITLIGQLQVKKYIPVLFWSVIVSTSTAGTTMSDYMDRTLKLGYANGSIILATILLTVLLFWYQSEKSLSVTNINSFNGELFYWTAILFSNTLGTALGDFLADNSGLGFGGGVILISTILVIVVLAHYYSRIPTVILFWIAFVLTRPFGATFGDLLTKGSDQDGLGFGTAGSSLILFSILAVLIAYETTKKMIFKKKSIN